MCNSVIHRFYEVEQALKERERHPINQRVKHPLEPVLTNLQFVVAYIDYNIGLHIIVSKCFISWENVSCQGRISVEVNCGNGVMYLTMACKAVIKVYAKYLRQ
ncbi:hypothetical protein Tco_0849350, partial [Tanacetum coccineum]